MLVHGDRTTLERLARRPGTPRQWRQGHAPCSSPQEVGQSGRRSQARNQLGQVIVGRWRKRYVRIASTTSSMSQVLVRPGGREDPRRQAQRCHALSDPLAGLGYGCGPDLGRPPRVSASSRVARSCSNCRPSCCLSRPGSANNSSHASGSSDESPQSGVADSK
jgi:hypothetical protein